MAVAVRFVGGSVVGLAIARVDLTASALQAVFGRSADARAAQRILALPMVLERLDSPIAVKTCGMDRQTPRDTTL